MNMETLTVFHPLQDVLINERVFDEEHRMSVTVIPQPGRIIFKTDVVVQDCMFDGRERGRPLLFCGGMDDRPLLMITDGRCLAALGVA